MIKTDPRLIMTRKDSTVTIEIYGAKLEVNKVDGDVFPIAVEFRSINSQQTNVMLFRLPENVCISEIPIRHPKETLLQTTDWFVSFYETLLYNAMLGVDDYDFSQQRFASSKQFTKITWKNDLGKLFIKIHDTSPSESHPRAGQLILQDYAVIFDFKHRDLHPNSRKLPHMVPFTTDFDYEVASISGRYNAKGLEFMVYEKKDFNSHYLKERFHCTFKYPLTCEDILRISVEGDKALSLPWSRFCHEPSKVGPDTTTTLPIGDFDYQELHATTLGDFFYLTSAYNRLNVALHPHVGLVAIRGVWHEINSHPDATEDEKKRWMKKFSKEQRRFLSHQPACDIEKATLQACVEFHDQFRDAIWSRAMSAPQTNL